MSIFKKGARRLVRLVDRSRHRGLDRLYKNTALIHAWLYGAGGEIHSSSRFCVPVRINGAGKVLIDADVQLGYRLAPIMGNGRILIQARSPESQISIGAGTVTSNNISMVCQQSIAVGTGCLIGDQVAIYDTDFHELDPKKRDGRSASSFPVVIGNNVWLGSRVSIMKGVTIGDNSVIGAMSLVTKPVPKNCVAAGIPAKIISKFGEDQD